jgi:signal transduction histidine kinase
MILPSDVRGWVCVPHMCRDRVVGILAFDSTGQGFKARLALMTERQRLEGMLQQVRRLDTIGALASGIAHNFNNIVGAILGYAEMAQGQMEAGKMPAAHLLEIKQAGERARDLVEQILRLGAKRPRAKKRYHSRICCPRRNPCSLPRFRRRSPFRSTWISVT